MWVTCLTHDTDRLTIMPMSYRWLPSFVALSALWGSSFALIKVGVQAGVPPLWVALWRCS